MIMPTTEAMTDALRAAIPDGWELEDEGPVYDCAGYVYAGYTYMDLYHPDRDASVTIELNLHYDTEPWVGVNGVAYPDDDLDTIRLSDSMDIPVRSPTHLRLLVQTICEGLLDILEAVPA